MANVSDTITWATHETAVREHVGIPAPDQKVLLERLLGSACAAADDFMGNNFLELDADGVETTTDIVWLGVQKYAGIELGVLEWIRVYLELSTQSVGGVIAAGPKTIKTDKLAVGYGGSSTVGGGALGGYAAAATDAVSSLWRPHRFPRAGGEAVWF